MSIQKRVSKLEAVSNIKRRCMVVVVVYNGTEGPTDEEFELFRERQKEKGECDKCGGSCNWTARPLEIRQQPDAGRQRQEAN